MLYPFGKNRVPYIDVLKRANFSKTGNLDLAEEKRRKEEVQPEKIYTTTAKLKGKKEGKWETFHSFTVHQGTIIRIVKSVGFGILKRKTRPFRKASQASGSS